MGLHQCAMLLHMAGRNTDFFLPYLVISVVVSHRYRPATRVLECSHTSGFVTLATVAHRLTVSRLHEDEATLRAAWGKLGCRGSFGCQDVAVMERFHSPLNMHVDTICDRVWWSLWGRDRRLKACFSSLWLFLSSLQAEAYHLECV